jgi:hypothetical protein
VEDGGWRVKDGMEGEGVSRGDVGASPYRNVEGTGSQWIPGGQEVGRRWAEDER